MALPSLYGRITVPSGGWIVRVTDSGGTQNITIPAGDYYHESNTGSQHLIDTFFAACTANSTLAGTYSGSLAATADSATGKLTITVTGGGNVTFDWTTSPANSSALRDAWGFTGTLSGAATYTSSEQCEYLWLPNVKRTNAMEPEPTASTHELGHEEIDATFTMAPSGAVKSLAYTRRFSLGLDWAFLTAPKTWIQHESTTNESLQKFWRDVISLGKAFRYYPDRSVTKTSSAIHYTLIADQRGGFRPQPTNPSWVGSTSTWNFQQPAFKLV